MAERGHKRTCDGCTACCHTHPVKELDKSAHQTCSHCHLWGCGIYSTRPLGCRDFVCQWLVGFGGDDCRPDRIGAVLDLQESPMLERLVMTIWEYSPGSLQSAAVKNLTRDILAAALIVIWINSQGVSCLFLPPGQMLSRKIRRELTRQGIKLLKTFAIEG